MTAGWMQLKLLEALHDVLDPETGVNLVDLGLIYAVEFEPADGSVQVHMTLTTPACPAGGVMVEGVERRLSQFPEVRSVAVSVVFEPRWTPELITEEGRAALGW
ncbi:metal-sulfur cluster assembly factor [Vulgatibacter sp.]|uniref:metal-sulfur cluster assembly factor n=1 Tax=Vulgatibacter sp. TaxID=1971226 RepID=UPI003569A981